MHQKQLRFLQLDLCEGARTHADMRMRTLNRFSRPAHWATARLAVRIIVLVSNIGARKETTMSFFSRSGRSSGGFTNKRTGAFVSPTRARQHTGQSIGGYTKTRSSSTGNYYMKKTGR